VKGWLLKAFSDQTAIRASLQAGAFDAACFHAQQAAEKALKAFLMNAGSTFPFTHNLSKLVQACTEKDAAFAGLADTVEPLTPYAVELRYDADFWPERLEAEQAASRADSVVRFVLSKLPERFRSIKTNER
jgi:HEPN domain-containing protein